MSVEKTSQFAPVGRELPSVIQRQVADLQAVPLLQAMIDAMAERVVLLNDKRQVVAANQSLLTMLQTASPNICGKRPGEMLGCIHAPEGEDGCGSSPHCALCGAVGAVLECHRTGQQSVRECHISLSSPPSQAIDLHMTVTPFDVAGKRFMICAIKDISDRKRLEVLSRSFFHDVLNTVGNLRGYATMLAEHGGRRIEPKDDLRRLAVLAELLCEQIESHRDLMYAESGDLDVMVKPVRIRRFLEGLQMLYAMHPAIAGRQVRMAKVWDGVIQTDPRLLERVIGNMLKNALEATEPNGVVLLACEEDGSNVVFSVHNAGVIPEEIQLQIFQRSFSTKASSGRGIGTHSMKLFGERYLGGQVGFTSTETGGTTFYFSLPKKAAG